MFIKRSSIVDSASGAQYSSKETVLATPTPRLAAQLTTDAAAQMVPASALHGTVLTLLDAAALLANGFAADLIFDARRCSVAAATALARSKQLMSSGNPLQAPRARRCARKLVARSNQDNCVRAKAAMPAAKRE